MARARPDEPRAMPEWPVLRDRLWRIALALTHSRYDADDLTQQTLATVLARQPDCADPMAYARRTMLHLWLDQQRSDRRPDVPRNPLPVFGFRPCCGRRGVTGIQMVGQQGAQQRGHGKFLDLIGLGRGQARIRVIAPEHPIRTHRVTRGSSRSTLTTCTT